MSDRGGSIRSPVCPHGTNFAAAPTRSVPNGSSPSAELCFDVAHADTQCHGATPAAVRCNAAIREALRAAPEPTPPPAAGVDGRDQARQGAKLCRYSSSDFNDRESNAVKFAVVFQCFEFNVNLPGRVDG